MPSYLSFTGGFGCLFSFPPLNAHSSWLPNWSPCCHSSPLLPLTPVLPPTSHPSTTQQPEHLDQIVSPEISSGFPWCLKKIQVFFSWPTVPYVSRSLPTSPTSPFLTPPAHYAASLASFHFLNMSRSLRLQGLCLCSSFCLKPSAPGSSPARLFHIIQISVQTPPPWRPSLKLHPCRRYPPCQRFFNCILFTALVLLCIVHCQSLLPPRTHSFAH